MRYVFPGATWEFRRRVEFSGRHRPGRAEQSYELLNVVTLRHLPYPPVYFSLANIDLPEYYLVLVAG